VTYTIRVDNIGVEDVTLMSLLDDKFGDLGEQGTCDLPQIILVGGYYECTVTKYLSSSDLEPHTNVVTASAVDDDGTKATDTDDETVTFTGGVMPTMIVVTKYYDANSNGVYDTGEMPIADWHIQVLDEGSVIVGEGLTGSDGTFTIELPAGTYTVREFILASWMATTPASVIVVLEAGETETVSFGNLCLGAGGGLTPGYWSNKNGQKTFEDVIGTEDALGALTELNLWKYDKKTGLLTEFDPTTYKDFKAWLQARDAVDMRYQASAHLAAMTLNVMSGNVNGDAVVYAGPLGFMTIDELMQAADDELGKSSPDMARLELLKNALDKANNNYNFVQDDACPFTPWQDPMEATTLLTTTRDSTIYIKLE
jgi:hypothetical protein